MPLATSDCWRCESAWAWPSCACAVCTCASADLHVRLRDREAGAQAAVLEPGDDLALLDAHALLDQHLGQRAGDLGRDRRLAAGGDVAGGLQHRAGARRRCRARSRSAVCTAIGRAPSSHQAAAPTSATTTSTAERQPQPRGRRRRRLPGARRRCAAGSAVSDRCRSRTGLRAEAAILGEESRRARLAVASPADRGPGDWRSACGSRRTVPPARPAWRGARRSRPRAPCRASPSRAKAVRAMAGQVAQPAPVAAAHATHQLVAVDAAACRCR